MHRHVGMEVVYVSEGHLRRVVEGNNENIPHGSVFFSLPWQVHGSAYTHEPGNRIHFIQFRLDKTYRDPVPSFGFHPDFGVPLDKARALSKVFIGATRHGWPASDALKWLILTLVDRLEKGDRSLFVRGLCQCMISELAQVMSDREIKKQHLNPNERKVQDLINCIEKNCTERWTLARMTSQALLKKTHLTDIFKKLTGDSPVAYAQRVRVLKAERLLMNTEKPVTEIGFECGYSTTQLFCRTFKKFTNRTPIQYRREKQSQSESRVIEWTEEDELNRKRAVREHKWV